MQSRSWLDLITNVSERCKMILNVIKAVCNFSAGQSAQKMSRSSQLPEASRLNANLSNGLPSRVSRLKHA
jgi:hypothetical protein